MKFTYTDDVKAGDVVKFNALSATIVGLDIGFKSCKGYSDLVADGVIMGTVQGMTPRPQVRADMLEGAAAVKGAELLIRQSEASTIRILFGDHAEKEFESRPNALSRKVSDSLDTVPGRLPQVVQFVQAMLSLVLPTPGEHTVQLVYGIPVAVLETDRFYDKEIEKWLVGLHEFTALKGYDEDGTPIYRDYRVMITKAVVKEQPLGALADYVYNMDGSNNGDRSMAELIEQVVSIVDWGGKWLDLLTYSPDRNEDGQRTVRRSDPMSGGGEAGFNAVLDHVRANLFTPHKLQLTDAQIEEAIRVGYYKDKRHPNKRHPAADGGGKVSMIAAVRAAQEAQWFVGLELLQQKLGPSAQNVDLVFNTGGAAAFQEDNMNNFFGEGRVLGVLPDDFEEPVQAPFAPYLNQRDAVLRNARGLYKSGKRRWRES